MESRVPKRALPLFQIPLAVPRAPRLLPDSGTNTSSVFGPDSLAALDTSEEQLEALELLRAIPLRTLESIDKRVGAGDLKRSVYSQSRGAVDSVSRLSQMIIDRDITDAQLNRMIQFAAAEKRASGNAAALRSFCKSLRARYSTLGKHKLKELREGLLQAKAVLALDIGAVRQRLGEVALSNSEESRKVHELAVESSLFAEALGVHSLPAITQAIEDAINKESSDLKSKFLETQSLSGSSLLDELVPPTSYTADHALIDCETVEYLVGGKKHTAFLDEVYYRLSKINSNFMSSTPVELLLPRVISACLERVSYNSMLGQLALAFLASYDRVGRVRWLSAAHANLKLLCITTQLGELVGATASPVHSKMLSLCEALFPAFTSDAIRPQPDEMIALSSKAMEMGGRCWMYEQRLPWMPLSARPSGCVSGALDMLRADKPLNMIAGDQWMHLKWVGFSGEPDRSVFVDGKFNRSETWRSRLPEDLVLSFESHLAGDSELANDIRERLEALQLSLDGLPVYFDTRPRTEEKIEDDVLEDWATWGVE